MKKTAAKKSAHAEELAELALKIMSAFHDLDRHHEQPQTLTMRQYQAMILLSVNDQLTVSELCEKLTLAPSTGTELVNRLLQLGYVAKQTADVDRRVVGLSLTNKGRRVLQQRQQDIITMLSSFLQKFEESEEEELLRSFRRIYELMQLRKNRKSPRT
ncbi:MarR family transcriptional regulator [candidate division KSB1 bacterium]|nr:MarR family transcriptional regulator [candidate division KSB1 bacterium]